MSTVTSSSCPLQTSTSSQEADIINSISNKERLRSQQPGPYDVLCERNRKAFNHVGNRRFRVICENHAALYADTKKKGEKGRVLSTVLDIVRVSGGKFIAKKDDNWVELASIQAREKVGIGLRSAAMAARRSQKKACTVSSTSPTAVKSNHDEISSPKTSQDCEVKAVPAVIQLPAVELSEKKVLADMAGSSSTNLNSLADAMASHFLGAALERIDETIDCTSTEQTKGELLDDFFDMADMDAVEMDEMFSMSSLMDLQEMDDGDYDNLSESTPLEDENDMLQDEEDRQLTSVLLDLESQLGNSAASVYASPLLTEIAVAKRARPFRPSKHSSLSAYGIQ